MAQDFFAVVTELELSLEKHRQKQFHESSKGLSF